MKKVRVRSKPGRLRGTAGPAEGREGTPVGGGGVAAVGTPTKEAGEGYPPKSHPLFDHLFF